jgi:hypothetical protein
MQDFCRIFIRGIQSVAAFQRLYESWKEEWEEDLFAPDFSRPSRVVCVQPPFTLLLEEPATPTSVVVWLQRTTGTMKDTLDLFKEHLIAHGILNYDLDLRNCIPAKPDPVVHARFK